MRCRGELVLCVMDVSASIASGSRCSRKNVKASGPRLWIALFWHRKYRVISYLRRTFLGLRRDFAQIELSQIYL